MITPRLIAKQIMLERNYRTYLEASRATQIEAFEEIANGYGLDVPDNLSDIIDADSSADNKIRAKIKGQSADRKISKLVKHFYPDLNEDQIRDFIEDYKAMIAGSSGDYEFKTENPGRCYTIGIDSCMTDQHHLTNTYNYLPVEGLILYKDDEPIGRALLWELGSKNYLDRVYPANDNTIIKMYHDYAKKQGWSYRQDQGYDDYYSDEVGELEIIIDGYEDKNLQIPYMDTFRFGYDNGAGDLILTNDPDSNYDFTFNQTDGVNLSGGEAWLDDVLLGDAQYDASSDMEDDWHLTWYDGVWKNGDWHNGEWRDGIWEDGTWHDGIWEDGTWHGGTWEDGLWEDGDWRDGWWENGEWRDGEWHNGDWRDGEFKGGTWHNGTWDDGTWYDGIWEDGTWESGYWDGGTWKDGTWVNGWIYDPDKEGNFQADWKWDNEYVYSSISPKEYFAK